MPKLPDKRALGEPAMRSGGGVVTAKDFGAPFSAEEFGGDGGLRALGAGLKGLGADIESSESKSRDQAERDQRFAALTAFDEFTTKVEMDRSKAIRDMPAGAEGFTQSWETNAREQYTSFYNSLPNDPKIRREFDHRLQAHENNQKRYMYDQELNEQDRFGKYKLQEQADIAVGKVTPETLDDMRGAMRQYVKTARVHPRERYSLLRTYDKMLQTEALNRAAADAAADPLNDEKRERYLQFAHGSEEVAKGGKTSLARRRFEYDPELDLEDDEGRPNPQAPLEAGGVPPGRGGNMPMFPVGGSMQGKSIRDVPLGGKGPNSRGTGPAVRIDERGRPKAHAGLDIPGKIGDPVFAIRPGTVVKVGNDGNGYGPFVDIKYDDGTVHRLGHLGDTDKGGRQTAYGPGIREGAQVQPGQTVGYLGVGGNAGHDFPHVHYEVFKDENGYRAKGAQPSVRGLDARLHPYAYFQGRHVSATVADDGRDERRGTGGTQIASGGGNFENRARDLIRSQEGWNTGGYDAKGQYATGYGSTAKYPGEKIDKEEAERRLAADTKRAAGMVEKFAPNAPEGVKTALTSLTYNAGAAWMKDGLGEAVKAGDYAKAKELFVQYNKVEGQKSEGVANRRLREAPLFDEPATPVSERGITAGHPRQFAGVAQKGGGTVTDVTPIELDPKTGQPLPQQAQAPQAASSTLPVAVGDPSFYGQGMAPTSTGMAQTDHRGRVNAWHGEETGTHQYTGPLTNVPLNARLAKTRMVDAARAKAVNEIEADIKKYDAAAVSDGVAPPLKELARLKGLIAKSDDPYLKQQVQAMELKAFAMNEYGRFPPEVEEENIAAFEAAHRDENGQLRLDDEQLKALKARKAMANKNRADIARNGLEWAHAKRYVKLDDVVFARPETLRKRAQDVEIADAATGKPGPFFTEREEKGMKELVDRGGKPMLQVFGTMVKETGKKAPQYLAQIAKTVPTAPWMGGLMIDAEKTKSPELLKAAEDAARGVELRRAREKDGIKVPFSLKEDDPAKAVRDIVTNEYADAFITDPIAKRGLVQMAEDIYEARAHGRNLATHNGDLWKESLRAAAGEHTVNGVKYGGIVHQEQGVWGGNKGRAVPVPSHMARDVFPQFRDVLTQQDIDGGADAAMQQMQPRVGVSARVQAMDRAKVVSGGESPPMSADAPTSQLPGMWRHDTEESVGPAYMGPVYDTGKPVSIGDFRRAKLVASGEGDGQYLMALADPTSRDPRYLKTANGSNYIFNVDQFEDVVRRRRGGEFYLDKDKKPTSPPPGMMKLGGPTYDNLSPEAREDVNARYPNPGLKERPDENSPQFYPMPGTDRRKLEYLLTPQEIEEWEENSEGRSHLDADGEYTPEFEKMFFDRPARSLPLPIPDSKGDPRTSKKMMLGGPGAMSAPSAVKKTLFAGEESKTADHGMAAEAKEMAKANKSAGEIYEATGWFKSRMGQWKSEIDDSKSRVTGIDGETEVSLARLDGKRRVLSDVFKHDDLYDAYPELAKEKITFTNDANIPAMGWVNAGSTDGVFINLAFVKDRDALHKLLLHETQHLLQVKSGEQTEMIRDHLTKPTHGQRRQERESYEAEQRSGMSTGARRMSPPGPVKDADFERIMQMRKWSPNTVFFNSGGKAVKYEEWITNLERNMDARRDKLDPIEVMNADKPLMAATGGKKKK